ncbi:MAG: hypothetical protein ACN0LA_10875 [Candidatus Longimicrobiales bacterium M2_2A_002]
MPSDRDQGDLFPWEEHEPVEEREAAKRAEVEETGDPGAAEAPEGAGTAGPRRAPGLVSREKVLWEWPYPGDWIEEEPA